MTITQEKELLQEFALLKPWDEVDEIKEPVNYKGYSKLYTNGHGYLIVLKGDKNYRKAKKYTTFQGDLARYLEEDSEAGKFLDSLTN